MSEVGEERSAYQVTKGSVLLEEHHNAEVMEQRGGRADGIALRNIAELRHRGKLRPTNHRHSALASLLNVTKPRSGQPHAKTQPKHTLSSPEREESERIRRAKRPYLHDQVFEGEISRGNDLAHVWRLEDEPLNHLAQLV